MKKYIIYTLFALLVIYFSCDNLSAAILGDVNTYELKVRTVASNESDNTIVTSIYRNSTVTLVDTNKISGPGCSDGWYKINYSGSNAYVCSTYITNIREQKITTNNLYYTTTDFGYRVNTTYVNVRTGPGTGYNAIELLYLGTPVKVLSQTSSNLGCSKGWLKVSYYNNKEGFVCSNYLSTYTDLTSTNEEYAKTLKEVGFPESYIPFLTKIHEEHPTWKFTPSFVNATFDQAISSEEYKNGIQINDPNYTIPGTKYEGSYYRTVSAIDAFYLDPRNYLTSQNIFVFETLSYDKELHTPDVIKDIFAGSFMETDEFVGYYMKAADTYNVSPVLLAIRSRQEGKTRTNADGTRVDPGTTGTYSGKYNNNSLLNLYNFYNIETYADTVTLEPIERGLAFAGNFIPNSKNIFGIWDTPEKAIVGGAGWISMGYVSRKQDTLYYQKFDTSPESSTSLGGHQFMTYILGHEAEAITAYYTYQQNGLLDSGFVFKIPVYKDMPQAFTSHPILGSNNNNLANISINDKTIDNFSSDELEYNFYIDDVTTSLTVVATKSDSTAQVTYNNEPYEMKLDETSKTINITVTAQNGATKTYIINIIRSKGGKTIDDILSTLSVKTNTTYMSNIDFGTLTSTLTSSIKNADANSNVVITDASNNVIATSQTLKTGQKIEITSSNNEKVSFNIIVRGDNNGDGEVNIVDLVKIQKHLLNSSSLNNEYFYASDIDLNGKVDIVDLVKVQKYLLNVSNL